MAERTRWEEENYQAQVERAAMMRAKKSEMTKKRREAGLGPKKQNRYTANADIRDMMAKYGVNQAELAKEVGLSVSTFNKWLSKELPDNLKFAIVTRMLNMEKVEKKMIEELKEKAAKRGKE